MWTIPLKIKLTKLSKYFTQFQGGRRYWIVNYHGILSLWTRFLIPWVFLSNLDWLVQTSSVQSFYIIVIYRRGNLFNIIEMYKFIDHCLIPLDPWKIQSFKNQIMNGLILHNSRSEATLRCMYRIVRLIQRG